MSELTLTVVLGLDASTTSTGWAKVDYETGGLLSTGVIVPPKKLSIEKRMLHVAMAMPAEVGGMELISNAAIEFPLVGRGGSTDKALNQLYGMLVVRLHERGIPAIPVVVASLKKWATGNGNADKAQMMEAAADKFRRPFATDDEADAAWAALWGREQVMVAVEEASHA